MNAALGFDPAFEANAAYPRGGRKLALPESLTYIVSIGRACQIGRHDWPCQANFGMHDHEQP